MGGGGHEPGLSFLIFLKRFQDPLVKCQEKKRQQYDGSDIQQKKEETLSVDLRLQGIKGRQDDDLQGAAVSFGHSNAGAVAFVLCSKEKPRRDIRTGSSLSVEEPAFWRRGGV